MLKIYNCIATAHDLRLVVLAAIVCALSSFATFRLMHHARTVQGQMYRIWLAVSAVSIGFGIWSTHFIAMLAFSPGIPSGYNIALTALSLMAAILLTGAGLAVSMIPGWRAGPFLGGAIVAGGIAAMHYTGMAAFEIAGIVVWDFGMVAASIVLGAVLGAVALPVGLHDTSEKWKAAGAVLLTLAICSHHFTGMAAVTILPDPNITVPDTALPPALLAILVCAASLTIILLALAAVSLDVRDRRRADTRIDPGDEIELPAQPLHLPDPEADEQRRAEQRERHQHRSPHSAARGRRQHVRHGMFRMSAADIGIMLVLRWYITQVEPESTMTRMMTVNSSAIIDQPPSILGLMCRK